MSGPIQKQAEFNQNIWYETYDPDFLDLNFKSRVTANWMSHFPVIAKYGDAPIIPISNYVDNIGIKPELVKIEENFVTIRQLAYADIYLLEESDKDFYNVDRTWIRQYYQTRNQRDAGDECFSKTYLFFTSWMPTFTTAVRYETIEGSPVKVFDKVDMWFYPEGGMEFVRPHLVPFNFKKIGSHMYDGELGIIRRGMPLFDITFSASDIIVQKIEDMYANN